MIEFDVETTGLQPWSGRWQRLEVGEAWVGPYAFLYQFFDGETAVAYRYSPTDRAHYDAIQSWFDRGQEEGIRAWNSKFDWAFAEQAGFRVPSGDRWHDGMLVAHAINERRSVALKAVAVELFGSDADDLQRRVKDWLTRERRRRAREARQEGTELVEPNYGDVPMELMEPYGLEDVILTRKVMDTYELLLANQPELVRPIEFERETMATLFDIERRGLPASLDGYLKLEQECIENLERLEDEVMDLAREGDPVIFAKELGKGDQIEVSEDGKVISYPAGVGSLLEFNPRSSQQVIAALRARRADMAFMSERNGKLSADAENLATVDDPLASAILEFRAEMKVLTTYVRPMIARTLDRSIRAYKEPYITPEGRIHANYRQVGARTGRMSCSDPNMQNQPRDDLRLRYNIVADPGFKIITCDLSNIEMVLFAAYAGEGRLLDAVRRGDDLHLLTARMLGLRDRKRPGGVIETARQLGKTYNFSRVYGGGLRTIRRQFRCDMNEARLLKQRFDKAYPEVGRLQTRIDYTLSDRGYLTDQLISGRRFRVDPRDSYKAVNYLVQGTAAALLKYAINRLYEDRVPMVALVHDEIVAHAPADEAEEIRDLIIKRMTYHPGLDGVVPLRADGDIVDRWSDAKPLKDEEGRLYYFDPKWANVERRYVEA